MKKNLFFTLISYFFLTLCGACSTADSTAPVVPHEAQLSLGIQIFDAQTRASALYKMAHCESFEEIKRLAQIDSLQVRFNIKKEGVEATEVSRKLRWVKGDRFIADPYALAKGEYELTALSVWLAVPGAERMLFTAVGSEVESDIAGFLAGKLLPIPVVIDERHLFDKTTLSVTVVCVDDQNPEDFGFKMWDLNFVKFHRVPFMINICEPNSMHEVLTGKLEIYADGDVTAQGYTQGDLLHTIYFKEGDMNKLVIPDNYKIANSEESYTYVLYQLDAAVADQVPTANDQYNKLRTKVVAVETLLQYKQDDAWMADYQLLDIDLCDFTHAWIFSEQEVGLKLQFKPYGCYIDRGLQHTTELFVTQVAAPDYRVVREVTHLSHTDENGLLTVTLPNDPAVDDVDECYRLYFRAPISPEEGYEQMCTFIQLEGTTPDALRFDHIALDRMSSTWFNFTQHTLMTTYFLWEDSYYRVWLCDSRIPDGYGTK